MVKAPFDPGQLIDLERFPIHDLDRSLGCDFLRECQAELDATGACSLAGKARRNSHSPNLRSVTRTSSYRSRR